MNSEMVRYQRYRAKCANRTAKKDPEVSIITSYLVLAGAWNNYNIPTPGLLPWRGAALRPLAAPVPPREPGQPGLGLQHGQGRQGDGLSGMNTRELKKCYKYVTIPLFKVDHIWWNWCFRKWIWGTRFQHLNVLSVKYKPVYFKRLGAQTVTIMKIYHL